MSEEREKRFISQYMKEEFPNGNYAMNVPLGPLPEETVAQVGLVDAANIMRPWRRRIDAVAWTPHNYLLIEAKIRDPLEGFGRLQTYRDLAKFTPDLPMYQDQELVMWLVVPFSLDWIQVAAAQAGIKLVIKWYDWIESYIQERQLYFTAEYRKARADKMRQRRLLGVE